jgi:hypothetical protein
MTAKIEETTFGKWSALRLSNDELDFVIAPALGGKITSLRSAPTNRQWLWSNPYLPQRDPAFRTDRSQTDYVDGFDTGGWDEVFPTIDSCFLKDTPWGDGPLADHGEIWRRPAEVTFTTGNDSTSASVLLRIGGQPLPFTFERRFTLAADEARFEIVYRITNHAEHPLPYIWAAHPLLRIEPGMRIDLPEHVVLSCAAGTGDNLPAFGRGFTWPLAPRDGLEPLDLSRVPEPIGAALKLFTQPLDPGWVAVSSADGRESFRLDFSNSPSQCIGLWLNYGGWSGSGSPPYFNTGIEPTTSPCDTLTDAITQNLAAVVAPGEIQQWTLTTTLTQHEGE